MGKARSVTTSICRAEKRQARPPFCLAGAMIGVFVVRFLVKCFPMGSLCVGRAFFCELLLSTFLSCGLGVLGCGAR